MDNKQESKLFGLPLILVFFALLIMLPIIAVQLIVYQANRYQLQQVKDQVTIWQTAILKEVPQEATPSPELSPSPSSLKVVKPASNSGEVK